MKERQRDRKKIKNKDDYFVTKYKKMATKGRKMDETCFWALPDVHGMMGDPPGH